MHNYFGFDFEWSMSLVFCPIVFVFVLFYIFTTIFNEVYRTVVLVIHSNTYTQTPYKCIRHFNAGKF